MNYWEQFGLTQNPYTNLPLLEGGEMPITSAFVGRSIERKRINTLLLTEDTICVAICGDLGIGKTSFANYTKFVWKYKEKDKPLFSFRREIEATPSLLNKRTFLLEIIGSILREIELLEPNLLSSNSLLMRLNHMIDVTQTLGITGGVSASILGLSVQTTIAEKQINQPFNLTTASLEKQFEKLLKFLLTQPVAGRQYYGLVIHVNNFEIAMKNSKKQVMLFFSEIRDLLQTPHVSFFFLGPTSLYSEIIAKDPRVKSVFTGAPIVLAPLTKEELLTALNTRLALCKSPTAEHVIKPFSDEVITELYDLYNGDIRMIMASLKDILVTFAHSLPKTLSSKEALTLLSKNRLDELTNKITPEQMLVLGCIIRSPEPITQNEIAQTLGKSPTNISNYYFKPLIQNAIIEVKSQSGRNKYWGLTRHYLPLKTLATNA